MKAINPATGELIRDYPEMPGEEVVRRLATAADAFALWRHNSFSERTARLHALAAALRQRKEELALLITDEMGKPVVQSEAEIEKCAWVCDYYVEHGPRMLADTPVETDALRSYIRYEPLGPVLAVMPWNFPFWQVFRFAAPAVVAGNVAVLKHASNVPGCALAIEDLFRQAEFMPGVMTSLLVPSSRVEDLIANPHVRAVTLTGSEQAGSRVASLAGREIKKTVLELGGSDPFIILSDADPELAAAMALDARMINTGQSCIAAKRFVVEEPLAGRFEEALVEKVEALAVGDPRDRQTQIGPLAREDLLSELDRLVSKSLAAGASLRVGGRRLDRPGYFYAPTVLGDVHPGMPVFDEETFGPVIAVTRAADRQQAIELANRSRYGLGATVLAHDVEEAQRSIVPAIEAGAVFVNGPVKSDPRLPFGGIKHSGYGRELAEFGIREFVNVKTVWIGSPRAGAAADNRRPTE